MSLLDAGSKSANLVRSFFKLVYENLEVGKDLTGLVNYDDDLFRTTGLDKWVRFTFLNLGSRVPSFQQVQATCAVRTMASDPQNLALIQLVDDVIEALNENAIPMYDFSSDANNPTRVVLDIGRGDQEMEAGIRLIGPNPRQPTLDSGVASWILTFGIWLWKDSIIQ